jgi:hypothetical protein
MLLNSCKFVIIAGLALLAVGAASGRPAAAASPTPFLEQATIIGAGGTLTVDRVPVETATGSVVYRDILMVFGADSLGNLSLMRGYPKFQHDPPIVASPFIAGNYAGPPTLANGKYLITVTGPGVGVNGSTQWLLSTAQGADGCTYPQSAFWFTGPIADNPLASRLQAAGITSPEFSYGVAGGPCCDPPGSVSSVLQLEGKSFRAQTKIGCADPLML